MPLLSRIYSALASPSGQRSTRRNSDERTNDVNDPDSSTKRPRKRRYDFAIVSALAVLLVALWIMSLSGVRARMATRAWERGDVEGAYRLAAMATRQRPEMADMWLLQARCEERLGSSCDAALSYARTVLAATEQIAEETSAALASGSPSDGPVGIPAAETHLSEVRATALRQALVSAAICETVSTLATVFEALTVGVPSAPQQRSGIWPGSPEIATGRETPESLSTVLPVDPELQVRWIEFLWRRQQTVAALGAARLLLAADADLSAAGLWRLGHILLASSDRDGAVSAIQQALGRDPEWAPAAADLDRLGVSPDVDRGRVWRQEPLALEAAIVDAPLWELRAEALVLATNGSVTFEIDVPDGTRRAFLVLSTWGTAANGRFPEIGMIVGDVARPSFEATGRRFPTVIEIPADVVTITFVFANDWADDTADRNVFFGPPTVYYSP